MNQTALLQFALTRGIGEVAIKKAMSFIERNRLTWNTFTNDRSALRQFGLGEDKIADIYAARRQAEILYERILSDKIEMITENQKEYPQYLKLALGDRCPVILFASGNTDLLNSVSVGFCGARKTSTKGLGIAADCARQFAEERITVVSGYAAGADLAAHKAALEHGGNTIFVLAEGILQASRKKEIRELLTDSNHAYVSQFMPDAVWRAGNAMRRNHVIIGLSRAMMLIESRKEGGTFATGEETLRIGCPLFVIHFAHPEVSAEANPYFLAKGGKTIRSKDGIPNISKVLDAIKQTDCSGMQALSTSDNSQLKFF